MQALLYGMLKVTLVSCWRNSKGDRLDACLCVGAVAVPVTKKGVRVFAAVHTTDWTHQHRHSTLIRAPAGSYMAPIQLKLRISKGVLA